MSVGLGERADGRNAKAEHEEPDRRFDRPKDGAMNVEIEKAGAALSWPLRPIH